MTELMSPEFVPYSLERMNELKPYYTQYLSEIHDLNLTNQLIWKKKHNLHTLEIDGYLWFVYQPHDPFEMMFSEPVGNYEDLEGLVKATQKFVDFCKENGYALRLRHIGERYKQFLELNGCALASAPIEDDFDYVYEAEAMAKLAGNKYHKKKNHLNQFLKAHVNRYETLTVDETNAQSALEAATNWCISNGCKDSLDLCHEYRGIKKILENWKFFQDYGVEGVLIKVDGEPVAFSFGERIQNDTFLVHIEKADPTYPGAYTAITHAMSNQVVSRCLYLNREQDMGIEGIRKAKQSFHPHHLVPKYDGVISDSNPV